MGTSRAGAKHHPAKTIARAMALLATGTPVDEVARQVGVPRQTISNWGKILPEVGAGGTEKRAIVEQLFGEFLEESLRVLLVQIKESAKPHWITKQTAADLAAYQSGLFDRAIRIYDAAKRADDLWQEQQRQLSA